ncbi:MAG: conjugal transfer protein TraX, partial [Eubacteriales bacterium]|nr:conjugal transfer protein TraX [Eubacteriales bacterium]
SILLFYTRKSKWKTVLAMAAVVILNLGLIPVDLDVLIYFGCTFAGILPVCLYNGKPGKHRCKWLFYIYYPAHVYVLYLVSWWMLTR